MIFWIQNLHPLIFFLVKRSATYLLGAQVCLIEYISIEVLGLFFSGGLGDFDAKYFWGVKSGCFGGSQYEALLDPPLGMR